MSTNPTLRELWLTPDVKWFVERLGMTDAAKALLSQANEMMRPSTKLDGFICSFEEHRNLMIVAEPAQGSTVERVVVWNGPEDGAFFKPSILEKAERWEIATD